MSGLPVGGITLAMPCPACVSSVRTMLLLLCNAKMAIMRLHMLLLHADPLGATTL